MGNNPFELAAFPPKVPKTQTFEAPAKPCDYFLIGNFPSGF